MRSIDEFVDVVNTELGMTVSPETVRRDLDEVEGWDSIHLLSLCTILEQRTGRRLDLAEVMQARSLEHIYALVAQR